LYYFREFDLLSLTLFAILTLGWALGGMMLLAGCTRLKRSELWLAGLASGFLLLVVLANLLARFFTLPAAFWLSTALIFGSGLFLWLHTGRAPLTYGWHALGSIGMLLLLTYLFQIIMRGLAVFDEFLHLPMISIMAVGDIPPHFYLDPSKYFAYHYGLQVWSAGLVRMAGFMPWSAFDLSRAFMLALAFMLGWVLFSRFTRSSLAALASAFLTLFAGGTRWLLILLPDPILRWLSSDVVLINSGANTATNLQQALSQPWVVEGMGQLPIPFAFHNSLFVPTHFILGSTGAMPFMTVLLLLILFPRIDWSMPAGVMLAAIMASIALSGEHIFVMLWLGIAIALIPGSSWKRAQPGGDKQAQTGFWVLSLGLSAILAVFQGGFITEAVRSYATNSIAPMNVASLNFHGFGVRWPPALPSAHFEPLNPFKLSNLFLLLVELGPVLLLAPAVTYLAWRRRRGRHVLWVGMAIAALLSMLVPFFVRYGVDRSITRLPGTALWLWLVLGLQMFLLVSPHLKHPWKTVIVILLCLSTASGIVLFALEMTAIPEAQFSYYIDLLDTRMAARYWNRLPERAQILDRMAYRSVALFGRPARSFSGIYDPLPEWSQLVTSPAVEYVVREGYDYVYMDSNWWADLEPEIRLTYAAPCVKQVDEVSFKNIEFRRLYDLRACGG
jgi:hypothetical protein